MGGLEQYDNGDSNRTRLRFDQLQIDYEALLRIIQGKRTLGQDPKVVGFILQSDTLLNHGTSNYPEMRESKLYKISTKSSTLRCLVYWHWS